MSELEPTAVLAAPNGTPPTPEDPDAGSVFADLRALRQEILDRAPLELPIPGYRGRLVARYEPFAWERGMEILSRGAEDNNPRANLNVWADELIQACVGVFRRTDDGLQRIADGYGPDLADALGFQSSTAREVLFGTFGDPQPSDQPHEDKGAGVKVARHHTTVLQWMQGVDEDDDGALDRADKEAQGE